MLEKILMDMYVDPEILAGLDETQKQTLFCKMREEQIRRWRLWDQKSSETIGSARPNAAAKCVSFLCGDDGEPWTWVMGEHATDRTIDDILRDEAQQRARQMAECEAKELRKTVEAELHDIIIDDYDQKKAKCVDEDLLASPKIDEMEIYCSVDELRERMNNAKQTQLTSTAAPSSPNHTLSQQTQALNNFNNRPVNINFTQSSANRDVLQEISPNRPSQKVAARIALWEQRVIGERTTELLRRFQKEQQDTAKEAEESATKQEELWREQERKAKRAETQIREIARRARAEHRKSLTVDDQMPDITDEDGNGQPPSPDPGTYSPPSSLDAGIPRPCSQAAVVRWYREQELPKCAGLQRDGKPAKWFHGLVTRAESERLLMDKVAGTFLVRVSERIWGYAISYRDMDKCKHYLVDASTGDYKFLGVNQLNHASINDLIEHHSRVPITMLGNVLLQQPCPPSQDVPDIMAAIVARA